ncbi:MAG: glycosyltransferase family 39 protein [Saprospiraceae bacterium]|nr:glycosyltransferase family 39 protein [Saprospiraceae bacterium]
MFKVDNTLNYLKFTILALLAVLIPSFIGMFIDVMDIDSSQYAAMSKEMFETGNYLKVYNRGEDYLDKPPLLFWSSALMYSIFGVSHFVFRIFPVLTAFLGIYATYRFGALYYNKKAGLYAGLIWGSTQAFFLMNHDVRTDTMLVAFTITSILLLAEYLEKKQIKHFIAGFIVLGIAMMAKGPIGLMVPVLGIGTHLILSGRWREIIQWKWFVGIFITGIVLLPMCIGLYLQYDADPSKNESGLYFYFWKQSFGRLTGESHWNNNPPATFLLENFLWSFLPWTLIFILAFYYRIKNIVRSVRTNTAFKIEEYITLGGFILPFIALSTSKYQLPHYIFVVLPLAAILCGNFLSNLTVGVNEKSDLFSEGSIKVLKKSIKIMQIFILIVILILTGVLGLYFFPDVVLWVWILFSLFIISALYLFFTKPTISTGIILPSVLMISAFNIFMNGHFYPAIMQYQSGSIIGKYVTAHPEIDKNKFYIHGTDLRFYAIDFYAGVRAPEMHSLYNLRILPSGEKRWLYIDKKGLNIIQKWNDIKIDILKETDRFHISMLTSGFLNPDSRKKNCQPVYLIEVIKR